MLKTFVSQNPKLAYSLGRAMFSVGGFLIILAVIGWTAKRILNIARGNVPEAPIERMSEIAQTPMFWLIPESVLGIVFAVLVAATGLYMAVAGGKTLKGYGTRGGRRRR